MTDQDRPQLSLGGPPGELDRKRNAVPRGWLGLLLCLQVVVIVCLVILLARPGGRVSSPSAGPPAPDADALRAAAMELEERSLSAQAARAWQAYLDADPETTERAEILYRIGRLYFEAEQFGEAAAALVQSELAAEGDEDLAAKIGPKLVECLRRLGRYGEVARELSRRVEVGADDTAKAKVLATLAGEPLTDADLDRMIERRVDQMLAMQGATDEVTRQAVLRQFSSPEARQQILEQLLQTELFCRRARELKLDQDETFLQTRQQMEQELLAGRFLAGELEKIQPTDVDLESYYKANPDQYQEPESAEVRVITLGAEEDPGELLEKVKSAEDFRKVAAERAPAGPSKEEGPPSRRIVRGRPDPLLGDVEAVFELAEGEWTKEPLDGGDGKHLVLVEKKVPACTPSLAEVRDQVRADYTRIKQREQTERLFRDLMTRYQVRILPPGGRQEEPAKSPAKKAKPQHSPPEAADASAESDKKETS